MSTFSGTLTALVTPFRGGQVDYDALERIIERQIEAGVDGLVPCGTTGESPTLTHGEHDEVIARVVKMVAGRVPVIAGTGSNSTEEAVHLSTQAARNGADGLLIVAPYYNKPTQEGLYRHFDTVARKVGLPIILYNAPGRTGVEITVDTVCRLRDMHGNIVAVKHATGRIGDAAELLQSCDITLLSGDDPLTLPLMSIGARGVISVLSNLAPRAVRRLTEAALAGNYAEALAAHRASYPLASALLSLATNPLPIKTALALKGCCAEEFRLPLCPMDPGPRAKLEELLAANPLE